MDIFLIIIFEPVDWILYGLNDQRLIKTFKVGPWFSPCMFLNIYLDEFGFVENFD